MRTKIFFKAEGEANVITFLPETTKRHQSLPALTFTYYFRYLFSATCFSLLPSKNWVSRHQKLLLKPVHFTRISGWAILIAGQQVRFSIIP